eukprot:490287_1
MHTHLHSVLTKACSRCRVELPSHAYYKETRHSDGLASACKGCTASSDNLFRILVRTARKRQIKWNLAESIKSCIFDLDPGFLRTLLSIQRGSCFYSGVSLSLLQLSHWQMSLERLNPNIGYRKDNVALVALELNSRAQMTLRKMSQIPHLIASEPNITFQQLNGLTHKFTRKKNGKYNKKLERENELYCSYCCAWQLNEHFIFCDSRCDTCERKRKREYYKTLRGFLKNLLANAKHNAKKKAIMGMHERN